MSNDDRDGRRKRLWIILAIAAAAVIAVVAISIVGSRVDSDVSTVRKRAHSATIDPSTIAFESYSADDNSVADALGVEPTALMLQQDLGNPWCVTVEISHLTSSQSLHFRVDEDGALSENDSC